MSDEIKYHFNPESGKTGVCKATVQDCKFAKDGVMPVHYNNETDARVAFEKQNENFTVKTLTKANVSDLNNKDVKTIDPTLLGDSETDSDRLEEVYGAYGKMNVWFKNTNGDNMGFIALYDYDDKLSLCDIEIKDEYRGLGLSKRLIKACEKKYEKKMTHEGGYTPEGLERIAPLFHSKEELENDKNIEMFRSMGFVDDWDNSVPKHFM